MATPLPVYQAIINGPRYTFFYYYSDSDNRSCKHWASERPQYFSRRPRSRRMASNERMSLVVRAYGRHVDDVFLDNVVKHSHSQHSFISRQTALASRGVIEKSTSSSDPARQCIKLRVHRPNCAASEDEIFWIVDKLPDGRDAVLRNDLNLETDSGANLVRFHQDRSQSYPIYT
jgi:hypothetical protein